MIAQYISFYTIQTYVYFSRQLLKGNYIWSYDFSSNIFGLLSLTISVYKLITFHQGHMLQRATKKAQANILQPSAFDLF